MSCGPAVVPSTGRAERARPSWLTPRVARLGAEVEDAPPAICPERALLWTEAVQTDRVASQPAGLRMADALAHVLAEKTVRIYPGELLVGNFTSQRVGGLIAPELHGVLTLLELHKMDRRDSGALQISAAHRRALRRLIPYWLTRNLAYQTHRSWGQRLRFVAESVRAKDWVINEVGGIAHFAPNYERLLSRGTEGVVADARKEQQACDPSSEAWAFLEGAVRAARGLAHFAQRYADCADAMARTEPDPGRAAELREIAEICRRVPARSARTLHEGLQSILLAQIALVNEGLEVTICPGRLDQLLAPLYEADVAAGRMDRDGAAELLACFVIKLSELVPAFAELPNRLFGGLPAYQTVVVGGVDRQGADATNELSYVLLDVVDALRMRQPNFHARLHAGAPAPFRRRVFAMLADGANAPALYNDEVIVPTLAAYGQRLEDARDYAPIGCVEPTAAGCSFASTDAVLFNAASVLELALNEGRRFGSRQRIGAPTPPAEALRSAGDVADAFTAQLRHRLAYMARDLRAVEGANAREKPTPLSSALIDGCLERHADVTAGGARYNRSGIQCVGGPDVGDSLRAIEQVVFAEQRLTLPALVDALRADLPDPVLRAHLGRATKFGNDDAAADRWTVFVVSAFSDAVEGLGESTRGGRYVAGLYSTTAHDHFGRVTPALPNGRRMGQPLTSGIAPANGADRLGPTAVLNSLNRIDFSRYPNGVNFNLKLQPPRPDDERAGELLSTLVDVYFARGGMQVQTNVLDAETLRRARADPDSHPHLLVRVSGYSAYFSDLSPQMQDEIIARTENPLGQ